MASEYKFFWTNEAISNLEDILEYIEGKWTQREVDNFKKRLSKQISLIEQTPTLFPVSQTTPRLRKAVLSKQTTIFYEASDRFIFLAFLFCNMQDIRRLE